VRQQLALIRLSPELLPFSLRSPAAQMEMQDPVLAQDGSTYERSAITDYITDHGVSPITGQPMAVQ